MQNSLLDLLRSSLIPELCSDISAGTSCNIQCILVAVSAMRTLPYELSFLICYDLNLSVISTFLTVITLCIEFRIHNVVINETDDLKYGCNVVFHVRNFYIADCSTGRKCLELRFKLQFRECINLFSDKYMIAVCNITLICNSRNNAKSLLQTFCELIGCTYES